MNTKIKICMIAIAFILLGNYSIVKADDLITIEDFEFNDVQSVLDKNEYEEFNAIEIIKKLIKGDSNTVLKDAVTNALKRAFSDIEFGKECVINVILIAIVSAFFTNFAQVFASKGMSDSGFYICYIATMTICLAAFSTVCAISSAMLEMMIEFMQALIPTFFLSVGLVGQATALGFYELTLGIILAVNYVFIKILLPILKIYVVITMANNISNEDLMSKAAQLLKRAVVFINKTMLSVIVGLNVIQGLVLPSVDGAKNTAVKKIAGILPVIGDSSDYVTDVFLSTGKLIKNSMGAFAIIVIICICAVPIIKLMVYSVSFQLASVIIQPVTDKRIVECISCVYEAVKMLIRTLMTSAFLFLITIAMICVLTNIQ